MHDLTHHIPCIMLFEDPQSYSTEVGELLNKKLVKEIYQAGNKHESPEFVSIFFFLFSFSESGAPLTIISSSSFAPLDFQKRWRHFSCWIFELFNTRKNSNLGMVSERREISSSSTTQPFNHSTILTIQWPLAWKGKNPKFEHHFSDKKPQKAFSRNTQNPAWSFPPNKENWWQRNLHL